MYSSHEHLEYRSKAVSADISYDVQFICCCGCFAVVVDVGIFMSKQATTIFIATLVKQETGICHIENHTLQVSWDL